MTISLAPEPPAQGASLATLLVSCPDRRGIVATLSQVLYGHGANILDSDQHSDTVAGMFFQRIRFDTSELLTDHGTLERSIAEVAARFEMTYRLHYAKHPKRVAIFVSKYEHCLVDLLWRHRAGEFACTLAVVVSNHEDMRPTVESYGVDFRVFEMDAESKLAQEEQELALLDSLNIDLVVLARYMQILSPNFTSRYAGRVINIHHSFLPAFIGGKPYHQAYERGVK
ncbi:MAG TPA: formyltetrahydrofolate deformylase, partial [Polyangiaceae bacterium]